MKKLRLSKLVSLVILSFVLSLTLGANTFVKELDDSDTSGLNSNENLMIVRGSPWNTHHQNHHHHLYYNYWNGCWYWV
ncbi:hypothetical protein [Bacillus cereus]|uniref:hypothetical protein n=1 Tax=Bacillus cereus TaxID=1396 RepID=UPI00099535AA|nr:hypothetical protein [Bacillus cereus]OPA16468.1 hypothetical protein BHL54_07245 [Bacillus cereus]